MISLLSTGELPPELVSYARGKGVNIDVDLFIRTDATSDPAIISQINELSRRRVTAIFTSKRAVSAVAAVLTHLPDWSFFCIDSATRREVTTHWGGQSITGTAPDGAELAKKIATQKPDGELVFFCGDLRLDTIPELLRKHGIAFKEVVVYHTSQMPHTLGNTYDAYLFYSPSGAGSFFSRNKPENKLLVAIGETTAASLEKHNTGNNIIITSLKADKKEMIDLAIAFFTKKTPTYEN